MSYLVKHRFAGEIFPVLVGSASRRVGVDVLAEFLVDYAPNPLERTVPVLGDVIEPRSDGPLLAMSEEDWDFEDEQQ